MELDPTLNLSVNAKKFETFCTYKPFLKMNEYYVFIKSFTICSSTNTVVLDIKAFVLADDVGRVWFVRGSFLLHVSDDPLGDQLRNLHRQPRSQAKRHRVGNSKLKRV